MKGQVTGSRQVVKEATGWMEGQVDHPYRLRNGINGPTASDEEEGAPWTNDLSPSRLGSPVGPSRVRMKGGL